MDSMPLIDILIFGMVALFVGLRLYSVLGTKTGREPKPGPDPFSPEALKKDSRAKLARPDRPADNVTPFPTRAQPNGVVTTDGGLNAQVLDGIKAIRRIDSRFDPDQFIAGAGHAYETIVGAFAIGEKSVLKPLLDPSVFEGFATAIDNRLAVGHTQESQFVNIKGAEIREITTRGTIAEITVRFASDMIIVTRDANCAVVAGSPVSPREVIDLWTFARDMRSNDPNWLLIATGGAV